MLRERHNLPMLRCQSLISHLTSSNFFIYLLIHPPPDPFISFTYPASFLKSIATKCTLYVICQKYIVLIYPYKVCVHVWVYIIFGSDMSFKFYNCYTIMNCWWTKTSHEWFTIYAFRKFSGYLTNSLDQSHTMVKIDARIFSLWC